jgi:hypothetical protein
MPPTQLLTLLPGELIAPPPLLVPPDVLLSIYNLNTCPSF